jgi:hypothetical protein
MGSRKAHSLGRVRRRLIHLSKYRMCQRATAVNQNPNVKIKILTRPSLRQKGFKRLCLENIEHRSLISSDTSSIPTTTTAAAADL